MIKFDGRIVQFGFGAVGKSFYEKIKQEIEFNENEYFVITMDEFEFEAFVNLGGIVANFIINEITKENFKEVFGKYLREGDLLIDFADTVGTKDILEWCAQNNIMYLNTGEADWPENWYSIFNENLLKNEIRKKHNDNNQTNKYPIVLQHGNNPGLVSHFVKSGIEYIAKKQFRKDKKLKGLIQRNEFNKAAQRLGIRQIHVNDIDLQDVKKDMPYNSLYSTWCVDSFFFEMLSEATINFGTHEKIDLKSEECKLLDFENGFLELKNLAADIKCRTYYPGGKFEGYLVPHEETITIAKGLEVEENNRVCYRPSVIFLYSPCEAAKEYIENAKVNDYLNPDSEKPQDCENDDGLTIVRGYVYPEKSEIVYQEKIKSGTEYVGVLLIGDNFNPVWVGNRIEMSYLYKNKRNSYWQTPTITPVAMSALAATCWMIKNKEKGGIYFPDDIKEYKEIIKTAEKYISKTIYKTFDKEVIEKELNLKIEELQVKDIFIKKNKT